MAAGGEPPRPLEEDEIWAIIGNYVQAAKNAIEAGFGGVEIHASNGCLVDQFIQDVVNQRTDAWGGTVEKRSRFGIEVVKGVVAAVGKGKVGMRLSHFSTFQGMKVVKPEEQFGHLIKPVKEVGLACLHLVEPRVSGNADIEPMEKVGLRVEDLGQCDTGSLGWWLLT
ncbi:hypothetical protein N7G274_007709 [Stereocaulon virgatum]|uniref:NADH:flavin oxidoreductase/NADH oxidase N-terminal domain-containing protein n=1 Tax=Stereocaulon virgatum TaxID=373712 RepID=A0ABR4A4W1_9LECA